MDQLESKLRELNELKSRVQTLERELAQEAVNANWPPKDFYVYYYVVGGFVLGMIGAATSLLFNVVGSLIVDQSPLQLIQFYLTFPLGPAALPPEVFDPNSPLHAKFLEASSVPIAELPREAGLVGRNLNLALAIGCLLYLGTGMILGIPFQLIMKRWFDKTTFPIRFVITTVLGLLLWIINFYGILYWLQPLMFDGNWIVTFVPWYIGAATHLVFAWTMLAVEPFSSFVAYYHPAEAK